MIDVTVVIPHFNRPKQLQRAIESVVNQDYKGKVEIIVVDDASTAFDPDKLKFKEHFKLVHNSTNQGPGYSRNVGLKLAKGNYIAFLDCDDYWKSNFLNETLGLFTDDKLPFTFSTAEVHVNNQVKETRPKVWKSYENIIDSLFINGRPWGTGGLIWNRNILVEIGGYSNYRIWEDYELELRAAIFNNKTKGTENITWVIDRGNHERIQRYNEKAKAFIKICQIILKSEFRNNQSLRFQISKKINQLIKKLGNAGHGIFILRLIPYGLFFSKQKRDFIQFALKFFLKSFKKSRKAFDVQ